MENKTTAWTTTFYIVLVICILQYVFMTVPAISKNENIGPGLILGSLIPNSIIVFIFWLLKRKSEKKLIVIENISEHQENTKTKLANKFGSVKKIKLFPNNINLTSDEIIIVSIIIATILAFIIGYKFGNYFHYNHNGNKVINNNSNCISCDFQFNYLLAIGTFIVSGGITYFFLNRKSTFNDKQP